MTKILYSDKVLIAIVGLIPLYNTGSGRQGFSGHCFYQDFYPQEVFQLSFS
jgi:hypothetical protein